MSQEIQDIDRILRERFGHDAFRPHQREPIESVLAGRDTVVVMPTGEGKSLLYQLPALALPGMTLVVSPLIALMEDQTRKLRGLGIAAECIHSQMPSGDRQERMARAARGELDILYLTPERFRVPEFAELAPRLDVSLFAIDEAHCVSQWGHDFRPEYSKLGQAREGLAGRPSAIALTATAPPAVLDDVEKRLGLRSPRIFNHGIERPNLFLSVRRCWSRDEKEERLIERLRRTPGASIVYCALIRDVLELEETLRVAGLAPEIYHGKLTADERHTQLDHFLEAEAPLMVATNAFGMGVDRADIRAVYHFTIPARLESYYQEIGRVGRDGEPSLCELLYLEDDLAIQRQFIGWNNPDRDFLYQVSDALERRRDVLRSLDIEDLREALVYKSRNDRRLETALGLFRSWGVVSGCFEDQDIAFVRRLDEETLEENQPPDKMERALEALLAMARYASADEGCHKRVLSDYFATDPTDCADSCGLCRPVEEWLSENFGSPVETPVTAGGGGAARGDRDAPYKRGDWIKARRRYARVLAVQSRGDGFEIEVEYADDLRRGTIDTTRTRVERVE